MNVRLEVTYQTPKGMTTRFISDELQARNAIMLAEDLEKTGRTKNLMFIDRSDYTWSLKELKKYMEEIQTEAHNVTVYFDGGFELETKKSGLGCVIYYDKNGRSYRLRKNAAAMEFNSNNEAEYAALALGVQELTLLDVHHLPVTFIGDSNVVINQMTDEWPCYEPELVKWIDRIESQLEIMGITPEYELVSRKRNREADQLASQALKGVEITSTIELKSSE
ncbi:ribonuclease H family protein [Lentibacillus sp. N15]|uniref:ribonuclease H family protein n=1 Tax=Lentibacillus songyuanensis TaxID=3136161 RepID=UPI0031BB34CF